MPPYFKEPLFPEILHFDEGEFERFLILPEMVDPEGKPVTIEIISIDEKWMKLDNDTRTIKFTPQNDPNYGSHSFDIFLTDGDGVKSRLYRLNVCLGKPTFIKHKEAKRMCPEFNPL